MAILKEPEVFVRSKGRGVNLSGLPCLLERDFNALKDRADYLCTLRVIEQVGVVPAIQSLMRGTGLGWASTRAIRTLQKEALRRGATSIVIEEAWADKEREVVPHVPRGFYGQAAKDYADQVHLEEGSILPEKVVLHADLYRSKPIPWQWRIMVAD